MTRTSLLILLSFFALPTVAQLNDGTGSSTSGQECNDGPGVRRATGCTLVYDDSSLFQRQPDGTYRMRRIRPLFRPPVHKEQR